MSNLIALGQANVAGLKTTDNVTHNSVTSTTSVVAGTALTVSGAAGAGYVDIAQQSANPSAPAAGVQRVFPKADGKLYRETSSGTVEAVAFEGGGSRNVLLNSDGAIQQRGTGKNSTNSVYSLDRIMNNYGGTPGTISQQSSGYTGCVSGTCVRLASAASGTTAVALIMPNATVQTAVLIGQTATLQVKVRKSAGLTTGDFVFRVHTTTTADDTAANQQSGTIAFTSTIVNASLTTSFQTFSVTGSIPSTARSICVVMGSTNGITASQYLEVTDIQLEQGSVATPWRKCHPSAAAEIQACQSYYEPMGTGLVGSFASATNVTIGLRYIATKRIAPVVSLATTTITFFNNSTGNNFTSSGSTITGVGTNDAQGTVFQLTGFTSGALGNALFSLTSNIFNIDAEIN